MQYLGKVVALAWPVALLAILWLVVGIVALYYARSTRRPIFLFVGLSALLLVVAQSLSPLRAAYRHFSHQYLCTTTEQCKVEILFGAYKYEWLVDGLAVLLLLCGVLLEIRRARRRAAQGSAVRAAAQSPMGAPVAAGAAPAAPFAGQSYAQPAAQPMTGYGAPPPDAFGQDMPDAYGDQTAPTNIVPWPKDERPTLYQRPASGSGSLT